jgi:hypothetical protein
MTLGMRLRALFQAALLLSGCQRQPNAAETSPIVGAWYARVPGAPFTYQMYLFNSDGTMQESNPDAGDRHTSDSTGFGAWASDGKVVYGKFVEVTADRGSHAFVNRGDIAFRLTVDGDRLRGTETARFYDAGGKIVAGPLHATIQGTRVR